MNSFRCQPRYSGTSRLLTLAAIHACRSATAVPACSAVVQFLAVPQRPVLVPAGDEQQPRLGQRLDVRLLHIQTGPRSAPGRGPVPPNRGICPDSGNDLLTARGDIISHGPRPTASVHVSFRNEPRCGTRLPLSPAFGVKFGVVLHAALGSQTASRRRGRTDRDGVWSADSVLAQ